MKHGQKLNLAQQSPRFLLALVMGAAISFVGLAVPINAQDVDCDKSNLPQPVWESLDPCSEIFAVDIVRKRKGIVGIDLFGQNTVPVGGCLLIANYHSYPVVVLICTADGTREYPYDVLESSELTYFPINDDPRLAGTQFIVKVQSISGLQASLLVTIE